MPNFGFDPIVIILSLVSLSLAPFAILMVSSFVKIVIVLSLIRQALGVQQIPPNLVLNGLAIILSLYIMAPVAEETINLAVSAKKSLDQKQEQLKSKTVDQNENSNDKKEKTVSNTLNAKNYDELFSEMKPVFNSVKKPIENFLYKHSGAKERSFFIKTAKQIWPKNLSEELSDRNLMVLIPAFMISELTSAFEIGFLIYLPFIAIDLIISNILLAMGMMMVSPMTISLPFKLMLFVLVSGWNKLIEGLILTYK